MPDPSTRILTPADYREAEQQFRRDLETRAIALPSGSFVQGLPADGRWPRANATNKGRSGKGDAQYVFNLYDGWPRWTVVNFTDGLGWSSGYYLKQDRELTAEEEAAVARAIEENRRRADEMRARQERQWAEVAVRCRARWDTSQEASLIHPYLSRKAVKPYGIRQKGSFLLVPMIGEDGLIWSLQMIGEDGSKRYAKGGRSRYGYYTIPSAGGNGSTPLPSTVYVTEGFATGSTVAELTGAPVMVAFDAGKLRGAGERARRTWSDAKIIFAADDDWKTENNPGLRLANEAAEEVNALVAVPRFPETARGEKDTDFNDMRRVAGDDATRAQLERAGPPSDNYKVGDPIPPKYSESAIARIFTERYKNELRYVAKWGKWYQWTGKYWKHDERLQTFHLSRLVCEGVAARIKNQALARAVASAKTRAAILNLASSDPIIGTFADQWDAGLMLLGTPNGTVDLRTGITRPARQDDYITRVTAVAPDANCPTPLWTAFLDKIMQNNQEMIGYLQRVAGYILTGLIIEHAMFFLYGQGGNGKSIFWMTLADILGDYHTSAVIETFTETPGDRHPTEMAKLCGARFVTSVETEEGRRWNESRITSSTGGDKISARYMRQDFFDFVPMFKLMIIGNYKPSLRSVSQAMKRRLQMVPFDYKITDEEKDLDFKEKLKVEWPGILWWAIQGCLTWQRDKLTPPQMVLDTTESYFAAENNIALWIEDCCMRGNNLFSSSSLLFESFKKWGERRGEFTGNLKKFVQRLEAEGFRSDRQADTSTGSVVRGFWGLAKVPTAEEQQVPPSDRGSGQQDMPF